jgi:hypothetical protein
MTSQIYRRLESGFPIVSNRPCNQDLWPKQGLAAQQTIHTTRYVLCQLSYINRPNSGSDAPPRTLDLEGHTGLGFHLSPKVLLGKKGVRLQNAEM